MNDILDIYIEYGVTLYNTGDHTVALPLDVVPHVLPLFHSIGMVIVGGDILQRTAHNRFVYTYDSWSYNGTSSRESTQAVVDYLQLLESTRTDLFVSFVFSHS